MLVIMYVCTYVCTYVCIYVCMCCCCLQVEKHLDFSPTGLAFNRILVGGTGGQSDGGQRGSDLGFWYRLVRFDNTNLLLEFARLAATNLFTYIHTYIYTYIHTYIHTYTLIYSTITTEMHTNIHTD